MSAATRERRSPVPTAPPPESPAPAAPPAVAPTKERKPAPDAALPFLLDFFPLEGPEHTRLSEFFDRLRKGSLSTTRCVQCSAVHWPPRVACPQCHGETLEWVDLPPGGTIYACSAVLVGAPTGMEHDLPFAVGLVDLDGSALRIFGRIEGKPWSELRIGDRVRFEPFTTGDGRVFYRFRAA